VAPPAAAGRGSVSNSMKTVRLTMAQALVRYLAAQRVQVDGATLPLFHGVFAIFGHGNVAGLGEALAGMRAELPTLRAHNEQAMAHAAIAFAKAHRRRRLMACTTSVGPGATNLVTAAAVAHANRLPVLLLPGDTFASRQPDPVLQQLEHFDDPTISANDCLRPVSRYWDRILRPEQLLASLPQALSVLLDPADCGPATLALPQDVQAEAFDYPLAFFEPRLHPFERPRADREQLAAAVARLRAAKRPLIIVGGGMHYSDACATLAQFATTHGIAVAETQAGKGALAWDHPCNAGAIGVTGASSANQLLAEADLVLALGTRLADFTTGSGKLVRDFEGRLISVNVCRHDAIKRGALALRGDVRATLEELAPALAGWRAAEAWREGITELVRKWNGEVDSATRVKPGLPTDAQVLAVGTRLGDFATGSRALFANPRLQLVNLNVAAFDAVKHGALALAADARRGLKHLDMALEGWRAPEAWAAKAARLIVAWNKAADRATQAPRKGSNALPTDAQVLGAVNRAAGRHGLLVCAAGGLPGELHKLWRCQSPGGYHVEYGYSCMGYEIAGGLGVKMALPDRDVAVLVGDGSYLMMNSEIATSIAAGQPLIIVLADNHGYGCIHRLQRATAVVEHNNLLGESFPDAPADAGVDFVAHARALGAEALRAADIATLEQAVANARGAKRTTVIVIETDPESSTAAGGAWWNVPVAEVSGDTRVQAARAAWDRAIRDDEDKR